MFLRRKIHLSDIDTENLEIRIVVKKRLFLVISESESGRAKLCRSGALLFCVSVAIIFKLYFRF